MKRKDLEQAVRSLPTTPLFKAMRGLLALQEKLLVNATAPVEVIVAGGVAVHYWTRERATGDADCEFLSRVFLSTESVLYDDEQGDKQALYFDHNFSTSMAPMHEGYIDRRIRAPEWDPGTKIHAYVLAPVDLALSKLGRFAEHDQADICALAQNGLLDATEVETLAREAISYYVGDTSQLEHNLVTAVEAIKRCRPALSKPKPPNPGGAGFGGPG